MGRWGARVVEGDGLENRYARNGIVSSNLTPTAPLRENAVGQIKNLSGLTNRCFDIKFKA